MSQQLTVEQAETAQEKKELIRFQWEIYRDDPYWVPPLVSERVEFLDPSRHPFYQHADVALFLARRGGKVVGTIAAIANHRHNQFWDDQVGFFGLFEVVDDQEVADVLLQTAGDWLRQRGMTAIRGPANFSTNEEVGLFVDGLPGPPVIMMTYNPAYYATLIEGAGLVKVMDLVAYMSDLTPYYQSGLPERTLRIAEKVKERRGITVRKIDMRHFDQEVEHVKELYNSAWAKNWGFVPMTDQEIEHIAGQLRQMIDPDICSFVEKDGQPIGFALLLPDLNQPLLKAYPHPDTPEWWTMLKLFWHWKVRRSVDTVRGWASGVLEQHRGVGADAVLALEIAQAVMRKGYRRAELSWVLEENFMTKRMAELYGGKAYRTYRLYEKAL